MVPRESLNPEAPEFFPNLQVPSISWPSFPTLLSSQQYYFFFSSSLSQELHDPLQPLCVYYPATTLPPTSVIPSQLFGAPFSPSLSSEAEPTRFIDMSEDPNPLKDHVVQQQPKEEVVTGSKVADSKGLVQKKVFKAFISCGRRIDRCRSDELRLQAYTWRRKGKDIVEDNKCGHLKNQRLFHPQDQYFRSLRRKKPCCPLLPVRVDGEETTVMIRNIPSKYTRDMLVEFLDNHCMLENQRDKEAEKEDGEQHNILAFDFVYLPIDFKTGLNKGYAFVNFTNPKAAWKFLLTASNMKWDMFQSHKIREVVAARLQGKEELEKHFETMHFPCDSEQVLPVCFTPPRDGVIKGNERTIGKLVKPQEVSSGRRGSYIR
ncbi:uncharacterized protein LOC133287032 [Gastrolobium bilobum]|uniref:uncharacterized protein LOC133287032 n=1 Tax=Gastrolobium bilobum TaxID=150636 RepID=UPI002AB1E691|nr:uncharacterized protein LOC133287032 [Gastrolobium bilobum]